MEPDDEDYLSHYDLYLLIYLIYNYNYNIIINIERTDAEKLLECESFYQILGYFFGNEGGHIGAKRFLTICQNSDDPINCYGLTGLAYQYAWVEQKFDFQSFFKECCKIHEENYSIDIKFCENPGCETKIVEVADKVAYAKEVKKFVNSLEKTDTSNYDEFIKNWKNTYKQHIQDLSAVICSAICPSSRKWDTKQKDQIVNIEL